MVRLSLVHSPPAKLLRRLSSSAAAGGGGDPSRFNLLLTSHIRAHDPAAALSLFIRIRCEGVRIDSYTFPPVLAACSAAFLPSLLRQLHSLMIRTGCHPATIPSTALLHAYSKCSLLKDTRYLFDEIPVRDAVTWNALISCLSRHSLVGSAVSAFRSMVEDGVTPTGFTLCSVLKACALSCAVRPGKQVHARVVVVGDGSLVMGTGLIDFYSSCGAVQDAVVVFRRLDCARDAAVYNALVSGCARNGRYGEAFSILGEMELNAIALTSVLLVCLESFNLQYGKQIHCVMIRRGFDSDTISCNALVDVYAKCGEIKVAQFVFDRILDKDVVSWTSIIDAYGSHGHGVEALEMFKKMEEGEAGRALPNSVTFLSVLSACGHSGLVQEGKECFLLMKDKHGLDPGPEHYACLIDMLGRAHKIEEAWDLFCDAHDASNGKLSSAVYVAMLNACKVTSDVVRGVYVAKRLITLEPNDPSIYVLISNFYAAAGKWKAVEELRKVMCAKGLRKEKGSSQVVVDQCV